MVGVADGFAIEWSAGTDRTPGHDRNSPRRPARRHDGCEALMILNISLGHLALTVADVEAT